MILCIIRLLRFIFINIELAQRINFVKKNHENNHIFIHHLSEKYNLKKIDFSLLFCFLAFLLTDFQQNSDSSCQNSDSFLTEF
jgi:hypothetical protein